MRVLQDVVAFVAVMVGQHIDSYFDRLMLDSVASAARLVLVHNDLVGRGCDNDLRTLVAVVHIDTGTFDTDDDTVALDVRTAGCSMANVVAPPDSHHMQREAAVLVANPHAVDCRAVLDLGSGHGEAALELHRQAAIELAALEY